MTPLAFFFTLKRWKLLKKSNGMKILFFCLEHVSACFRTISIIGNIFYDEYVNGYIMCGWPITAIKYFI